MRDVTFTFNKTSDLLPIVLSRRNPSIIYSGWSEWVLIRVNDNIYTACLIAGPEGPFFVCAGQPYEEEEWRWPPEEVQEWAYRSPQPRWV